MPENINLKQNMHSRDGSKFELGNLHVPEKEFIEDESIIKYSSDSTCNKNRLEKYNADIADLNTNTRSDTISNEVVTRHLWYLLLSIVFAILILIASGALIFHSFQHHKKIGNMLQIKLLTPRQIMPTVCRKNEGPYYATNLKYYYKDRGAECKRGQREAVFGGKNAVPAEFPHQVYFAGSKVRCGGSILNEDFILTAAHCFFTSNGTWRDSSCRWRVVGGDTNLNQTEGTEQIRNISIIYTHPGFRSGSPTDDIALVKQSRPFKFDQFVQSPLLPTHNFSIKFEYLFESALYVSGYGDVSYKGTRPTILQKANLLIYTTSKCQGAYNDERIEITEKMICAGAWGRDACQGDSGGPLSFKRCDWSNYGSVLVGIVSGGIECGREEYPGVYTKVSEYMDWIQTSIENTSIWNNIV